MPMPPLYIISMTQPTTTIPLEYPDYPPNYSKDNGHGRPTHVFSKSMKQWIATPAKYRTRKSDGLRSHVLIKVEGGISEWYETPTLRQLEEWSFDGVCETPEEERVEPDHPRSWLSILGLI